MNKIVYSFWTAPLTKRWKEYREGLDLEDIIQSSLRCLYLSVLYSKKWGFEVEIVTDLESAPYFEKLPIDNLSTDLTFLSFEGSSWIEGKMLAISKQTKPFVHVDWDVMLRKKEVAKMIKNCQSDVIVQSLDDISFDENAISGNEVRWDQIENFKWIVDNSPFYVEELNRTHYKVYNTAIIGFNDLELRDAYIKDFLKCLHINRSSNKIRFFNADISKIIDQYLLYCVAKAQKATVETLLLKNERIQIEAKRIGYTHLTFLSKYTKPVQQQIKHLITNEFPEYDHLIGNKLLSDNKIKISLCTVVMNRFDHLITTLKHNLEVVKKFKGKVDINIIDYNSTDGLEDFLFSQNWFIEGVREGLIIYYKNYTAEYYHRSLPKNVVHYLALGEYLINIDADNFVSSSYLNYSLSLIEKEKRFFLRPSILCTGGSFGRIMVHREDFKKIGGYNLKIETYGYEDTEFTLRLRKMGVRQLAAPGHLCSDVIEHDDALRTVNERKHADTEAEEYSHDESDHQNKKINFELYPNKDKVINIELFKVNHNKTKIKVHDASTITLD
ncbi:DUF6734 family protein [Aquimarina spongiae]|uniref:N-terminal domain of galactosyltransferase n=1 Tax=Aquimarina spongiae TaxID=570521 RepID=A0A1M6IVQ2_9FLAO|nr:DUF6734 family protein [Aquimarina spongiae]SHJ38527.1 N-terminal domain of galactosyltransferase [Aquimarina spongiae]